MLALVSAGLACTAVTAATQTATRRCTMSAVAIGGESVRSVAIVPQDDKPKTNPGAEAAPQAPSQPERARPEQESSEAVKQAPAESTQQESSESTEQAPAASPQEAVGLAREAFERIDNGGDLQKEAAHINRLFKYLLENDKTNPWVLYIRGRSAMLSNRGVEGMRDLEEFSLTDPGKSDWKTFRLLGDAHVREYPRLAAARYRQALALNDREPSILLGLSQASFKLGERAEALAMAEKAMELDAGRSVGYLDNYAALIRLDALQRTEGRAEQLRKATLIVDKAITMVQDVVKKHGPNPGILRLLANEYESALILLRDILQDQPENVSAYQAAADVSFSLAEVRRQLQLHDALALIELQAMKRLEGKVPADLAMSYARLLVGVGRLADARTVYTKIIEGEPGHAGAMEALRRLDAEAPASTEDATPPGADAKAPPSAPDKPVPKPEQS